jgi:signal transduction histidine kinase
LRRRIPFLVQVPLAVVLVGLTAAAVLTWLGVQQLREQSDDAASLRGRLLLQTLSERLQTTSDEERRALLERAAERSGAELLLVTQNGRSVVDATLGAPSRAGIEQLLVVGTGETVTRAGRTRFASSALGSPLRHLSLVVFVPLETHPFGESSMVQFASLFAAILVAIAALAAYGLARSVHSDIAYIKSRIVRMARPGAGPTGEVVPVRTADAVGSMTKAFNAMIERFSQYETAYRHDLDKATAYAKERSEFLAALSHELRTPLNVILGFTDVLLSEVDGPLSDDAKENLGVVRSSGEHLQQLINDVLDLSAIESGSTQLHPRDTDVLSVASDVVQEARVAADAKGLALKVTGSSVVAWADPVRLRQIIGNLVGNAVKFTEKGEVEVHVEGDEQYAIVTVRDTGPGIAPDQRARVFEEFQQAAGAQAQRSGTGLGLAITRRLVKMHAGAIALESEVGTGSRFTVSLPRHAPAVPTPRSVVETAL